MRKVWMLLTICLFAGITMTSSVMSEEKSTSTFLEKAIEEKADLDFEPKQWSDELVRAKEPLGVESSQSLGNPYGGRTRGAVVNYTFISEVPAEIEMRVQGGLIYKEKSPVKLSLAYREDDDFDVIDKKEVPSDTKWHDIQFKVNEKGLYRVKWEDQMAGTRVKWPEELSLTTRTDIGPVKNVVGRHSWYFYVPEGTEVVGAYAQGKAGKLYNADGKEVLDFGETPTDYITIDVPEGQDGKLWKVHKLAGKFRLLNVPPYGAKNAEDLLLPAEVVETDAGQETKAE